jgi:hypothetical protein
MEGFDFPLSDSSLEKELRSGSPFVATSSPSLLDTFSSPTDVTEDSFIEHPHWTKHPKNRQIVIARIETNPNEKERRSSMK